MSGQAQTSPSNSTLDWFEASLRAAARSVNLETRNAPELASAIFRGGEASAQARLEPSELPSAVRGLRIDRYAVLIGLLPEVPSVEALNETLRRYRNQCVVARSYLTANEALDLQLFLIGPRGSEKADEWQSLALIVERDERVARKLAWRRPSNEASDAASFAEFIKRTFLARPWIHDAVFTMAALDNLNKAAAVGDVPRDTVGEWVQLAQTKRDDPAGLVEGLVNAWSRRGQA
ncbi:MAG: hypothetical protein EOQ55_23650 [Mesorhizobium sp.]|uniref:ABC-three component system middle component 1 n=1 Tax=Mesorhizobium sp. TaxID=1871066 RepID=UPI000FE58521|nr:ABC-three component system middle component 1 [Mesorhizobium sp.]RWG14587.1 MAG: hypothetical protein EOQ55_23650 [Mesorhizobium sp.]RWI86372.1 MAG: hypothetical protein EOR22_30035 [Mesorhizobium sp.]